MDTKAWLFLCGILSCSVHFGGCEVFSKTHLPGGAPVEQRSAMMDSSPMDNEIPGLNGPSTLPLKTTESIGPADVSSIFIPKSSNLHDTKPSTPSISNGTSTADPVISTTTQTWNTTTPTPYLINAFPLLNPHLYPNLPHQQVVTSLFPLATLAGSKAPGTPVINIWNVQISPLSSHLPPAWPLPGPPQPSEPVNVIPGVPASLPPQPAHEPLNDGPNEPSREQLFNSHPENVPPPPIHHGVKSSYQCTSRAVIINYGDIHKSSLGDCSPLMELNVGDEIVHQRPTGPIEGPRSPVDLVKHFASVIIDNVLRHAGIRSVEVTQAHGNVVNGHRLGWSDRVYKSGLSVLLTEMGPKILVVTLNGEVDTFEIGVNGEPRLVGPVPNFQKQNGPANPPFQPKNAPTKPSFQIQDGPVNPPFQPQAGPANPPFQPHSVPGAPPFQPQPQPQPHSPPFQPQNGPVNPPAQASMVYSLQQEPASYKSPPNGETKDLPKPEEKFRDNVNGTETNGQASNGSPVPVATAAPKVLEKPETSNSNTTDAKSDKKEQSQPVESSSNNQNGFQQAPQQKPQEQSQYGQQPQQPQQAQVPQQFHQPPQYPPPQQNQQFMNPNEGPAQPSERPGMVYSAGVPLNYPKPDPNTKNYNGPPPPAPPSYGFVGPNGPSAQDFNYNSGVPMVQASVAWAGYSQVSPNAPNGMEVNNGPVFDGRKSYEGPRGGPVFIRQ